MASKRRWRRKACTGKRRYDTLEEARKQCGYMWHVHQNSMKAYQCSFCGGVHVGHTTRSRYRNDIFKGVN